MQTSSAQHVQSMAAAMAELTRQNQELKMEFNLRRQAREERGGGGQTQSHDDRENIEIGSLLRGTTNGTTLERRDGPNEESHGRNERKYEKGKSYRRFGP